MKSVARTFANQIQQTSFLQVKCSNAHTAQIFGTICKIFWASVIITLCIAKIVYTEQGPCSRDLKMRESKALGMFEKSSVLINSSKQFSDCRISEMEHLRDDAGSLMIFYISKKLDALGTLNRKTWRSVGQVLEVSSDDLDLIETEYIAWRSPTETLLALFKAREKEPTMREFVQALIICGRNDIANFICNWPWTRT